MADLPAPAPELSLIRRVFAVKSVPRRWPFALRAGICMAVPVLVGWALGDVAAGLIATIGGFTSLYGSGRPYTNRGMYLGVVAMSLAVAVALGASAAAVPWLGVLTVSVIAMVAVLVCHALTIGPPGAYMFVIACAAGAGAAQAHHSPWRVGLLVLGGGAFAWLAHMAGALVRPRGPEKAAVAAAGTAIAEYIEAIGGDAAAEARARHHAAQLLYDAWTTLVTFQPVQPKPDTTLHRLRRVMRRLHVLFAEAMSAAENGGPLPPDTAALARHLATVPADAADGEQAAGETPLGRASAVVLLRQALTPGSASLHLAGRTGTAVVIAGAITLAVGIGQAYWAMSAAVLVLHQGFDWLRTVARGVERTLGTWVGLGVAGVILTLYPQGLWLALTVGVLQFIIEMLIVRNYTLAVIFITPSALIIGSGGRRVVDVLDLLLTRGFDTLVGCAIALLVYRLTPGRRASAGPAEAVAAALETVAVVVRHMASGAVTTAQARTDRRNLQLCANEMLAAYRAGIGGSTQQRVAAERLWPALVATNQLAYRTLAACWAVEHGGTTPVSRQDSSQLSSALAELAHSVRTDESPGAVPELPEFGEAEMRTVRESLVF